MMQKLRLKRIDEDQLDATRRQCHWAAIALFLCLVVLAARLGYLQLLRGDEYRRQSENNRLRTVRLQPPRGKILDRTGRLLAGVKPSFNICLTREDAKNVESLVQELIPLLGESEATIRTRIFQERKQPLWVPIVLKKDADWDTVAKVEARLFRLPGVMIEVTPKRQYPYGSVAPHLLGYLGEVSQEDLDSDRYPEARPGDLVGKYGIEARYEKTLAGQKGYRRMEVDASGRLVRVVDETPPIPGHDLYVTLDLDLQQAAESAMGDQVGAVVALDPNSGRILAMVSSPGFDPEVFARGVTNEDWKALNDPVTKPLLNKAMQGTYAPGSTFKIVSAAAALTEGVVGPQTSLYCPGFFRLGRRVFRCWDYRGHGQTNLYKALVESCDVYFYQVGLKLGVDRIAKYARAFGLGERTGIDLPHENAGLIPTAEWKRRRYKVSWQDGETLSVVIGQGFDLVTPLQMADLIAAVANGGTLYKPKFIEQELGANGEIEKGFQSELRGRVPVSQDNMALIRKALTGVVEGDHGTARQARIPGIQVAGKTGTAQVVAQTKRRQDEKMGWRFRDHAWFVAYAPAEKPQIAVAVLVEHGGHGGSAAAPIARKVIERWLQLQAPRPAPGPERSASLRKVRPGEPHV